MMNDPDQTKQARTEILTRLRRQRRAAAPPGTWPSRQQFDDPVAQFAQALTAVHGEVYVTRTVETAVARLDALLTELNARRVVGNNEPPLDQLDLPSRWPTIEWHLVGRSQGSLRDFCIHADVGLSSAAAALAETGSVLVKSGAGRSRLATLLPPVHVVLLPAARITADLFTFTAARDGGMPANMTFISGPSKTADIEQTMAIGVHGPKRFLVIVYRE